MSTRRICRRSCRSGSGINSPSMISVAPALRAASVSAVREVSASRDVSSSIREFATTGKSVNRLKLVANISLNTELTAADSGATRSRMRPTASTGRAGDREVAARHPRIESAEIAITVAAISDDRLPVFATLARGTGVETLLGTGGGASGSTAIRGVTAACDGGA